MKADNLIFKKAVINGLVSTFINGFTAWFELKEKEKIPFTLDNISNNEITVFGSVFPVVMSLCLILGIINYYTFRKIAQKEKLADPATLSKPFFPGVIKLILSKAFSAFGILMITAVLWQKYFGVIYTSRFVTSVIVGITAGLTSVYIGIAVSKEIIRSN